MLREHFSCGLYVETNIMYSMNNDLIHKQIIILSRFF